MSQTQDNDHDIALEHCRRPGRRARPPRVPAPLAPLREGMEETLTVIRLKITGEFGRTLESTNARESIIDTVRRAQPPLENWSSGEMGLRWTAAGMREAEQQVPQGRATPSFATARRRNRTRPHPPSQKAAISADDV